MGLMVDNTPCARKQPSFLLVGLFSALSFLFSPAARGQTDDLTGGSFYPDTLGGQVSRSSFISVLEIVKVDQKTGAVHYKKTADLKGVNPKREIRHYLKHQNDIWEWAKPGKMVIHFQGEPLCRFCIGDCWYGYSNNFETCYAMEALPVTYTGPVPKLRAAIVEIVAGREAIITAREWHDHFPDMESPAHRDWLRGKRGRIWRIKAGPSIVQPRTKICAENPKVFVGWGTAVDGNLARLQCLPEDWQHLSSMAPKLNQCLGSPTADLRARIL